MRLTKEQFNYLEEDGGKFTLDYLPFDDSDNHKMYLLFNALPQHIQGDVVSWGFSDTVVREKISEYIIEKEFGLTFDQYNDRYEELNKETLQINLHKYK
jgi:hypothetical protein